MSLMEGMRIEVAKECRVVDVSRKEAQKAAPTALNTVELMRVASSSLGMSPAHAMSVAERLYSQGFVSYPRTETTQYPPSFDIRAVLQQLTSSRWGDIVKKVSLSLGFFEIISFTNF